MLETAFSIVILFALGAAVGSFLHVIAERYMLRASSTLGVSPLTPSVFPACVKEIGVLFGRSMCPYCKKQLTATELIPIFSYIFQKATCRGCGARIPMHYICIELLSGFLAVALLAPAIFAGQELLVPILLYIAACVLIILMHIDARSMMLPDLFILFLGIIALALSLASDRAGDDMAFGALAGAGVIYAIWLATAGQGIGFGDVKLMMPLGILFGLQGTVTLLFIAFFIGGLVGIVLLATKRAGRKTEIPFGPFLAGAALLLLIFPNITGLLFGLFGVY